METTELSLSEKTRKVLECIHGDPTAFIEKAVCDRYHRYRHAKLTIKGEGIKRNELQALLDLLNGSTIPAELDPCKLIPLEMEEEAQRDRIHETHRITEARWKELTECLKGKALARAILLVSDEYWHGGQQDLRWLPRS